MSVSELGEFGLIELIRKLTSRTWNPETPAGKNLIIGIGDDCAVWHPEAAPHLITVDSFIQDVHFSLETTSWSALGWKALAVNLSDIAAMGGVPRYAVVSLAIPEDANVKDITALYEGMIELALENGVAIIGGDTSRASQVAINITVIGRGLFRDNSMLTRSAARVGDKIAVTGYLGGAAGGFKMLTERLNVSSEATAYLREAFLRPKPRLTEGQLLSKEGIKAAIDISDGLVADLGHICQASGLSARIVIDHLPVSPILQECFGSTALELAASGGEDYEILFTGNAELIIRVQKLARCPVTVIGEMISEAGNRVIITDKQGNPYPLRSGGWDHFGKV